MNEQTENFSEQGAAFQKIWLESMSRLMQAAFTFSPNSTPPEVLREIRNGILRALGESWNEYMRSPQFQENMKQWMDNAMSFRQMTNEFMAKVHKETRTPTDEDIDAIQQNMRHLETRILDRLDALSKQVELMNHRGSSIRTANSGSKKRSNPRPGGRRSKKDRVP
jgi:flagellar capping protein FliD